MTHAHDYLNENYPEPRDPSDFSDGTYDGLSPLDFPPLGDLEDGHLENDAWRKEHPDAER